MSPFRLQPGRYLLATAAMAGALVLTAGCTPKDDKAGSTPTTPAATSTPVSTPTTGAPVAAGSIEVERSGGFAGRQEVLTIDGAGKWTLTGSGAAKSGMLTAEQHTKLKALVASSALAKETSAKPNPNCADGFRYQVRTASSTVSWEDCGAGSTKPAIASQIVTLIDAWTGM